MHLLSIPIKYKLSFSFFFSGSYKIDQILIAKNAAMSNFDKNFNILLRSKLAELRKVPNQTQILKYKKKMTDPI